MSDTSSLETAVEFVDVPDWKPPKVTDTSLEWADILTVDLSLFETNRTELVNTVATALQRDGFFYVVGHGIEIEKVQMIFLAMYVEVGSDHISSCSVNFPSVN